MTDLSCCTEHARSVALRQCHKVTRRLLLRLITTGWEWEWTQDGFHTMICSLEPCAPSMSALSSTASKSSAWLWRSADTNSQLPLALTGSGLPGPLAAPCTTHGIAWSACQDLQQPARCLCAARVTLRKV